ncbi:MAG: hypothetical protein Q7U59_06340 [Lutibacter sp.]|nr:hypothetical protein [Lutibacter sp.]
MKHLKKLSVILMITTLFSVSFTSCIDNEVSPLVEAIYEAQADLIAAQAGVQNAEAALLLAQAANQQANSALLAAQAAAATSIAQGQLAVLLANAGLTDAQAQAVLAAAEGNLAQALADAGLTEAQAAQILANIADQEANAEYTAAVREQQLLVLAAQTSLDVANLQNALELAQITFQTQMAAAIAAMEAAGAQLAVGYAIDYRNAMWVANGILSDKLSAEASLAQAMLLQTGGVSYAYWLAQLQGTVDTNMAAKADLEAAIADLEAYIANPSTPEAIVSGLKAQSAMYEAAIDAKEIEMQVQYNKIMAIYEENSVRNDLDDRIFDSLGEHNYAVDQKNDRLDWIEDAEGDIADWELAITNYPAALAAKQLAVTNATTAKNTAQGVYDAAVLAQAAASSAQIAAASALTFLEGELATLYGSLQTAAATYATQKGIYDAGIGTATSNNTAAIAAVTAAQAARLTAFNNYTFWKGIFEGNPAGVTWFDEVSVLGTATAGADGYPNTMIGNHTDVALTSFRQVLTWIEGPVGEFYPNTYAATSVAAIPADVLPLEVYEEFTSAAYPNGIPTGTPTVVFFVEVENDDVSETNIAILNAMIATLGDEDIFDNPPVLPATYPSVMPTYLVGTDAYTNLWNAQMAQLETQYILDHFGDIKDAAYADYIYWKNLYENELDLLNAAQAVLATANTTLAAANTTLATATTNLGTANATLNAANLALSTFLATDIDDYQGWIDAAILDIADWNLEIDAIQPIIDAKYAVVAGLLGELTAAGIQYTFVVEADGTGTLVITNYGVLSSLYPDLHAAIIAEWQVYWEMDQELTALENSLNLNEDLIYAYGSADDLDDLADYLDVLKADLAAAIVNIELSQQALASGQVQADAAAAYIAYWQALVDTLEQRYANTLAIAAKYKALMEAALAS